MKKLLIISILFLVCSTVNASTMYVNLTVGNSDHAYLNVDANNDGNYENDKKEDGSYYSDAYRWAGNFELVFGNPNYGKAYGFCIDFATNSGSGDAQDTLGLITASDDGLRKSAWVMETFWNIGNSGSQNAGIQLAIWDFIYGIGENGFDRFVALDTAFGHQAYLEYNKIIAKYGSEYPSDGFDAVNYRTVDFLDKQDMIIKFNPVPEPATMALFGIGLLGISLVGRKRS